MQTYKLDSRRNGWIITSNKTMKKRKSSSLKPDRVNLSQWLTWREVAWSYRMKATRDKEIHHYLSGDKNGVPHHTGETRQDPCRNMIPRIVNSKRRSFSRMWWTDTYMVLVAAPPTVKQQLLPFSTPSSDILCFESESLWCADFNAAHSNPWCPMLWCRWFKDGKW